MSASTKSIKTMKEISDLKEQLSSRKEQINKKTIADLKEQLRSRDEENQYLRTRLSLFEMVEEGIILIDTVGTNQATHPRKWSDTHWVAPPAPVKRVRYFDEQD